jgi:hypothetical protein
MKNLHIDDKIAMVEKALPFPSSCLTYDRSIEGDLGVTISAQCVKEFGGDHPLASMQRFGGARNLVVKTSINWIVLNDGFLVLPRRELEAVLAHELVHYYRAHQTIAQGYQFFYKLDKVKNDGQQPSKLPASDPLATVAMKVRHVDASDGLTTTELQLLREARDGRLGFYTIEQEADEVALQYLRAVNREPKALADGLMSYLRKTQGSALKNLPEDLAWGHSKCESEYQAGFPKDLGVGIYNDPHHTSCFRIFNVQRHLKRPATKGEKVEDLASQ